ncbi:MAG TPA: hypothetical protein VHC22_08050 [Pirellulales bacterium]|nr:hypothetical protein [Pirellulales bacterium]
MNGQMPPQIGSVTNRPSAVRRLLMLFALLPCATACNRSAPTGYERYVPDAARAQEALDLVLGAWKNGEPAGELKLNSPDVTIQVADATRRPGQRLVDYELLGEISGEGPRTFAVRLKLDNPKAEREVRYYLVGIDPLWVFRQEDYDALIHWDACAPDEQEARETTSVVRVNGSIE